MKYILLLSLVFGFASCLEDVEQQDKFIHEYELLSLEGEVTPNPFVIGFVVNTRFTYVADNIDYKIVLNDVANTYTASGSYDLTMDFGLPTIPNVKEEVGDLVKSGTFIRNGDDIVFDSPVFELRTNDMKANIEFKSTWQKIN